MGLFLTIIFTCIALNTIVGLISHFRETDRYIDLCYSLGIVVLMLIAFF